MNNDMCCMKCGRQLPLGQVFCKECLADMANYPVKPGTPVQLPAEQKTSVRRSPARKARKPEEQLSRVRRLMTVMMLVFTLVVAAATVLIYSLCKRIETLEQTNVSLIQELENP